MILPVILMIQFLNFGTFLHQFYVSITEIEYNQSAHTLEVGIKVFSDDFIFAVEKDCACLLHYQTANQRPDTEKLMEQYVLKRFGLKVDDKSLKIQFTGIEPEADVIWIYLEAGGAVAGFSELEVENRLLMEQYSMQTNIVHLKVGNTKKSLLLNRTKFSDKIVIN